MAGSGGSKQQLMCSKVNLWRLVLTWACHGNREGSGLLGVVFLAPAETARGRSEVCGRSRLCDAMFENIIELLRGERNRDVS